MTTTHRTLKLGDVLIDNFQRPWTVTAIKDGVITLSDPYGIYKDRPIFVAVTEKPAFWENFRFCWNAVAVSPAVG